MTLIIGIKCTDGVVVAADSAVTHTSGKTPTISDTQNKIRLIDDRMILAGTGSVGLGQRFEQRLHDLWSTNGLKGLKPVEFGRKICEVVRGDFASTGVEKGCYGALLAFTSAREACITEFATEDLQPERKTEQLWYASMGSGQMLADPYLRLVRSVFWRDGPPDIQGARFAATWVMRNAIDAAPGFIGDPITMAVLESDGAKSFRARRLERHELDEHLEYVAAANEHFQDFLAAPEGGEKIPRLPAD